MNPETRRVTLIVGAAALLVGALFPVVSSDAYWYTLVATALVYGALALSLDVLWGHSGVLNLAPALAFGLGAYAWGIVTGEVDGILGTYLAIAAAVLVPAIFSGLVALVSFKAGTREIYFALITLAALLVLQQVAQSSTDLTGGSNGLIGIDYPTLGIPGIFEFTLETPDALYYLALVIAAIAFAFSVWLVWSRIGTVLAAVRESDLRTDTLGYSTLRYRVMVSAVAAGIAGLAGMAYAPITGIVDPTVLGVALSVQVFVWVAVGGGGSLIGPMLAAIALSIGQAELTGSSATAYLLGTGIVFILVVLFLPGGLASAIKYGARAFGGSGRVGGPSPAAETPGGARK